MKRFYADRARLMIFDRNAGTTAGLTENWDRSVDGLVWERDSRSLLGAIDDAGTRRVYRFRLDGGDAGGGDRGRRRSARLSLSRNGKGAGGDPPELRRAADAGVAGTAHRRRDQAHHLQRRRAGALDFGAVRKRHLQGRDATPTSRCGCSIHPASMPTKKYPVLMLLHGGPHNAITDAVQWRWNAQVFASWGYVVTWHNFHGSSGFGNDFADSINPDWITLPYEDTIKAAEWLMAKPFVDRERMVAAGGSYGGFLATTLLGRAASVQGAGGARRGLQHVHADRRRTTAPKPSASSTSGNKPEEFARYSPHTSAGKFKTPTLVIHNQQDLRVPVNHGIELFNTLQKRGVPSKLVYFPDENHWVLKPQNSLFWYQTVRDWVATYAQAWPVLVEEMPMKRRTLLALAAAGAAVRRAARRSAARSRSR